MTPRRTEIGFTLIEIIVVCTVAALLAAIVTTALIKGIFAAKSSSCLSNLQQIAKGLELYRGDNDGFFPPYGFQDFSGIKARQAEFKRSLDSYGTTDETFFCPLDTHKRTPFLGEFYSFENTSYWMPLDVYFAASAGPGGAMHFNASNVAKPSELPIFTDQSWLVEEESGKRLRQTSHKDRLNVLYLDGHVKSQAVSPP
jgi:prepilin-type processing-associated H-X9-DG protein/prepilin-type N-terminal cleavage/methylation domain-containing protein